VHFQRVARTALLGPLVLAGGLFITTLGSTSVFAASTTTHASVATPVTSSKPHKHEKVECSPSHVAENHGQCAVTFTDIGGKSAVGEFVCFSVSPTKAGAVATGTSNCAKIGKNDEAFGTFTASNSYCGPAVITALVSAPGEQPHHTTVTITCNKKATTTAAYVTTGSTFPPAGVWILGTLGVGGALITGFAVRTRRPRRLAARQSA
jgi:hypothetical protein